MIEIEHSATDDEQIINNHNCYSDGATTISLTSYDIVFVKDLWSLFIYITELIVEMQKFFASAPPIDREEFLLLYQKAILVTQLIFSPFGPPQAFTELMTLESACHDYSANYEQLQDLVAKKVFSIAGYDDDRIVASMHKFISKSNDEQVIL